LLERRRRLLVAGTVGRIVSGLDLREPLHADGADLSDGVFEPSALNLIFDLEMPQGTFEGDELPFLESPGELGEIALGIDAMPFGAGIVVTFVVPHYQVSFTRKGKSSSKFVRKDDLAAVRRELKNYEAMKTLVDRWIE
jgi:hypothetical protein